MLFRALPAVLFSGVALLIFLTAWIEEDAFITFRTIDNFIHGYGLRWNIAERVQTFTHPLWMFVLSFFALFTRELLYTTLLVSIATSLATVWVLTFRVAVSGGNAVMALLPLLFSQAFIHYSTSGLENPLSHLLLVLFFWLYFAGGREGKNLGWLFLIACLAVLNRMDTLLLYAPALLALLVQHGPRKVLPAAALGFLPLLAWEAFSLFYYGLLVPNTAYAKLNTAIPKAELMQQGLAYLANSARWDGITLLALLVAGIGVAVRKALVLVPLLAGALLYLAYVVNIGGDYMSGRFLSVVVVMAAVVLARLPLGTPRPWLAVAAAFVVMGLAAPLSPIRGGEVRDFDHGITDNRIRHAPFTGLWSLQVEDGVLVHPWAAEGAAVKAKQPQVQYRSAVGLFGYHAGREVHIVDPYALGDPLLARLPMARGDSWRIGHFTRVVPRGYTATLISGQNQIHVRPLAEYYDEIRLVTRGPLFSKARLQAIARLHLAPVPQIVREYGADAPREVPLAIVENFRVYRTGRNNHLIGTEGPQALFIHAIPASGLSIYVPDVDAAASQIRVVVEAERSFSVALIQDGVSIDSAELPAREGEGYATHSLRIPDNLDRGQPHELVLTPLEGGSSYLAMAAYLGPEGP